MNPEFNIQLYQLLRDWNPMQFEDSTQCDAEYYEIMDIIHQKYEDQITVKKINEVFNFSFDTSINEADIHHILNDIKLLNQSCSI